MAKNILWSPNNQKNLLNQFIINLNKKKYINNKNYNSLHRWSVKNKKKFWSEIWNFTKIIGKISGPIILNERNFFKTIFFKNSKLNYTKNLIKRNNDDDAIIFYSEKGIKRKISWKELDLQVSKISYFYKKENIKKGDRIACVMPNVPETVIAFLGAAKIGAIWSSCSSDFGPKAITDRFKQIKPKILIVSDYYFYNNKKIKTLNNVNTILKELKSVKKVIIVPYENKIISYRVKFKYINWLNIMKQNLYFDRYNDYDFNTPLYILYSSGTTGIPKCIVHGSGGALIQHKKEHLLHFNIQAKDRVFYFTTCGWMMWNWLISALSSNATIILYDGSPFAPNNEHLFKIAEKEKITFFGAGAKYFDYLKLNNCKIKKKYKLKYLKTIASTGSPLVNETFNYIYKNIKKNVHLASISGGTDLVSCFVLGNPNLPVYSGEIQCKSLGMDVAIFDNKGNELKNIKGELVCKTPFPSKPLFFWNDKDNKSYFNAYFNKYKNIWHHGDYAKETINKGYIIYGRSDATLNSGGVRIGTSELYRVVENIKGIEECIAAEQKYKNDTRVILFLKLNKNYKLHISFKKNINNKIKKLLSPKYVPAHIIDVIDIPKTRSGKIVELTIKKIINNEKIDNIDSLSNPECLKEFKDKVKKLS